MMAASTSTTAAAASAPVFHALPIQTDFEGTTDVYANFTAVMTHDAKTELWHTRLRGRHLIGAEVALPDDYAVALIDTAEPPTHSFLSSSPSTAYRTEKERDSGREVPVELSVRAAAPTYFQWEHDQPPAAAASLPQWIALASVLHATEPPPL